MLLEMLSLLDTNMNKLLALQVGNIFFNACQSYQCSELSFWRQADRLLFGLAIGCSSSRFSGSSLVWSPEELWRMHVLSV